jgi:hypothetical protein
MREARGRFWCFLLNEKEQENLPCASLDDNKAKGPTL